MLNSLGHLTEISKVYKLPLFWVPQLLAQCLALGELLGERKEERGEGRKERRTEGPLSLLQVVSTVASWAPLLLPWVGLTAPALLILCYKAGRPKSFPLTMEMPPVDVFQLVRDYEAETQTCPLRETSPSRRGFPDPSDSSCAHALCPPPGHSPSLTLPCAFSGL